MPNRVRNDEKVCLWCSVGSSLRQVADDGSIGVEQICPSSELGIIMGVSSSSVPSRVMPGFRGTPAGMRTTSAPFKASLKPDGVGS